MRVVLLFALFIGLVSAQCPHIDGPPLSAAGVISTGTAATIPSGNTYVFDFPGDSQFISLTIEGTLVFDPAVDVNLTVEFIKVADGGALIMGSEDEACQITSEIIITFIGSDPLSNQIGDDADGVSLGTKGLAVLIGGTIRLFGHTPGLTWTTLDATADKDATTITLSEDVEWSDGDKILIVSTDYGEVLDYSDYPDCFPPLATCSGTGSINYLRGRHFPDQTETRTIVSISNKRTITLDAPLDYMHYSGGFEHGEVALISRNILLQGDGDYASTPGAPGFGGHVIIRAAADAHLYGVELQHMGQSGTVGRYPIHFHLLKDLSDGFSVRKNSIHHCFQRSFVIHDSNSMIVEWNVAYETHGSMYFLEDGSEQNHVFNYNLGVNAQPVATESDVQIVLSDNEPSIFWISNPANDFVGNVAVGAKFGFWYVMPVSPNGLSVDDYPIASTQVRPRYLPLGKFDDNIAHGSQDTGIFIDDLQNMDGSVDLAPYTPRDGPYYENSASYQLEKVVANFERNIAYKCRRHGLWARGGPLRFNQCKFADNQFCYNAPPGATLLIDSDCYGETDNVGTTPDDIGYTGRTRPNQWGSEERLIGVETYDNGGPQYADDVRFYNFEWREDRPAGALSVLRGRFILHTRNRYSGFELNNANAVWFPDSILDGPTGSALLDIDGTVTGVDGGAWIVSDNDAMTNDNCEDRVEMWNAWICPVDRHPYVQVLLYVDDLPTADQSHNFYTNDSVDYFKGKVVALRGDGSRERPVTGDYDNPEFQFMFNVPSRQAYTFRWGNENLQGGDVYTMHSWGNDLYLRLTSSVKGDWVVMAIPYPSGTTFTISAYRYDSQPEFILEEVNFMSELKFGTYYYSSADQHLYVWLENVADTDDFEVEFDTYTDYSSSDGYRFVISASCDRCDLNTNSIPADPSDDLPHEDKYAGVACDDEPSDVVGNTNSFFYFNPERRLFSGMIFHDQHKQITGASIVDTRRDDRVVHAFEGESFSSPLRFSIPLSHEAWLSLAMGDLKFKLEGANDYTGSILCDVSYGDCTVPDPVPDPDECSPSGTVVATVFDDEPFGSWPDWQFYKPDWVDFDDAATDPVLCGDYSLYVHMNNSVYMAFAYPEDQSNPEITISDDMHFEFWFYLATPAESTTSFRLSFRDTENNPYPENYYECKSSDFMGYVGESGSWTRVKVAMSDMLSGSMTFGSVVVVLDEVPNGEWRGIYFDAMNFVSGGSDDMQGFDELDIKSAQECGFVGTGSDGDTGQEEDSAFSLRPHFL